VSHGGKKDRDNNRCGCVFQAVALQSSLTCYTLLPHPERFRALRFCLAILKCGFSVLEIESIISVGVA
jgi:hypothetical protein